MTPPALTFTFEIGKRQNVRLNHVDTYGEMVRTVTQTKWTQEKDGLWFHWYWTPEMGSDLVGSMDCGFAGMRILEPNGSPTPHHEHFIRL